MAKAREIQRRIRSIDNTRQITKTMEMVAASKLKKAQDRVIAARPFDEQMRSVMAHVRKGVVSGGRPRIQDTEQYPLLREEGVSNRVGVLLITSNRGLAGAFNANLIKEAASLVDQLKEEGKEVELHVVGKKGVSTLRYLGYPPDRAVTTLSDQPTYEEAGELVEPLIEAFLDRRLDEIQLVYSMFRSPVEQRPTSARLLPIPAQQGAGDEGDEGREYSPIYEYLPSPEAIYTTLLPLFVRYGVYRAVIESAASEHGARRTAMKNATDNAEEMIRVLTRSFNRARQAQITQEIAEVVGGGEALRG